MLNKLIYFSWSLIIIYYGIANCMINRLNQLSIDEKIGQLFIIGVWLGDTEKIKLKSQQMLPRKVERLIKKYKVGGLLFLGSGTLSQEKELITNYQEITKIPLLIAQDCEWGIGMRLKDGEIYSKNSDLGKLEDKNKIYKIARKIGQDCKNLGIHINLAPVVDINSNPKNPIISSRAFSDDKTVVAQCGLLYMRGLQDSGILACAKHFPGHGDTTVDSHYDLPKISKSLHELQNNELHPFKVLIKNGVDCVMVAHLEIPVLENSSVKLPTSLSYCVITKLLKEELKFNGLVITDALDMQALTKFYRPGEIEVKALLAGADILLCPADVKIAYKYIKNAINTGVISINELDQRILKILKLKEKLFGNTKLQN